jgi:hypothetical protein
VATTTISEGNTLKFDIGANSATLTPSTLAADVDINLPSSSGTLLLDSDLGGSNDITFDANYGIETGFSSIKFDSSNSSLNIISGSVVGSTEIQIFSGINGGQEFFVGTDPHLSMTYGQVAISDGISFAFIDSTYKASITSQTLTSNISLNLPTSSGTFALTSDVPSSINDLTDTPASLGTAGQVLAVDSAGTATEWVTPSGGAGGGGLGTDDQTLTADRTITTAGYNLDVEMTTGDTVTFHDGTNDLFQIDTNTTGTLFSVNDVSGLPMFEVESSGQVAIPTIATSAPTGTVSEGTMQFAIISGSYYLYAYLGGGWRSVQLT